MLNQDDRKFIANMYGETRKEFTRKTETFKNQTIEAIKKEAKKVRSDIAKFTSEILGKLANMEDNLTITEGYSDKLENHEERIEKLEQHTYAS